MTSSARTAWRAPLTLAFALACGAPAAQAQFFFRPFAHGFHYTIPEEEYEPAPYASRRAVARILAREGYRLVGGLGHRGEQVVATGVNRREGEMRFYIDPYEGYIIRGVRVGPPPELDRAPPGQGEYVEPLGGSRPVVRDLGEEPRARDRRERRRTAPEVARETPLRDVGRPEPRQITPPRTPAARVAPGPGGAAPASPPVKAEPPVVWRDPGSAPPPAATVAAKPAEPAPAIAKPPPPAPPPVQTKAAPPPAAIAAKPPEPAPAIAKPPPPAVVVAPKPVATPAQKPAPAAAAIVAKPSPAAATPSQRSWSQTAARVSGGSSHRAIVPPTTPKSASSEATPSAASPRRE